MPLPLSDASCHGYRYVPYERDRTRYQTTNRHPLTPGVRLYRKPKAGVTDFDVEAILQRGHEHATAVATDLTALPVKAWLAHAGVGHTLARSWQLRLEATVEYGSGREEDRRGGNRGVRTCKHRWYPDD